MFPAGLVEWKGRRAEKVRLGKLEDALLRGCGSVLIGWSSHSLLQLAPSGGRGSASWHKLPNPKLGLPIGCTSQVGSPSLPNNTDSLLDKMFRVLICIALLPGTTSHTNFQRLYQIVPTSLLALKAVIFKCCCVYELIDHDRSPTAGTHFFQIKMN